MRLHTEYGLQKLTMLRTFATVHIGVLENPTTNNNNDYYIIFKVVVKARTDPAYPKFTATQMDTRLLIMKTPQEQRSVTFSIIDAAISPITVRSCILTKSDVKFFMRNRKILNIIRFILVLSKLVVVWKTSLLIPGDE
ncbi:unnamed protein product [Heterobilharzia americana]|nr:unnamed protein product [Heterobilharzia americana]